MTALMRGGRLPDRVESFGDSLSPACSDSVWLDRSAAARIFDAFDDEFLAFGARVHAVALVQAFRQQLPQVTFAREMFRRM